MVQLYNKYVCVPMMLYWQYGAFCTCGYDIGFIIFLEMSYVQHKLYIIFRFYMGSWGHGLIYMGTDPHTARIDYFSVQGPISAQTAYNSEWISINGPRPCSSQRGGHLAPTPIHVWTWIPRRPLKQQDDSEVFINKTQYQSWHKLVPLGVLSLHDRISDGI